MLRVPSVCVRAGACRPPLTAYRALIHQSGRQIAAAAGAFILMVKLAAEAVFGPPFASLLGALLFLHQLLKPVAIVSLLLPRPFQLPNKLYFVSKCTVEFASSIQIVTTGLAIRAGLAVIVSPITYPGVVDICWGWAICMCWERL